MINSQFQILKSRFTILHFSFFIFNLIFLTPSVFWAQSAHQLAREGDKYFEKEKYKEAELGYRRAQEQKRNDATAYNLSNSVYKQQRYDEALEQYDRLSQNAKDKSLKTNSLYNQGNTHFYKKDYEKAIESYKNALRLNPNDVDAKKNLVLARRMQEKKKQEEEKKKQQQNQDKNKDKDQNKDQQKQDEKQKEEQQNQSKGDQNQQNEPKSDQNPQQNQQQPTQQDLKKEDAKRMLQIMDDEERKVQQRLQKGKPRPSRSSKDW